jgi:hypothetical protein
MPDTLEPTCGGRYRADMESSVTALEHIAPTTAANLERLEPRFQTIGPRFESIDRRIDPRTSEPRADFRSLLGLMLGGFTAMLVSFAAMLGEMAHGFHWL